MATYTLAPNVKRQFLDNSGNPLASGKLYTYLAGTSTAATVYQTSSGTAHANPIVLDSAGRISGSSEIYLDTSLSYKFTLNTSADVLVWTQDNIGPVPPSSVNVDIQGLFGAAADAGDLMYLSDGSGSLTAGSWYKADADLVYASLYPELAFAVNATAAGGTGTLRKDGQITLTGPLTPGDAYYVSATAGGITATAPTHMRYVGQAQSTTVLAMSMQPIVETVALRIKAVNDFRLSLTTAVPVTTADVTAAGTLFWTPYIGNAISLYTGSFWTTLTSAQLSIAVPAAANQVYDAFVDYNDGTPQLALTAWTNDTTRATALTTQDGILVKTGDTQQRYVGTVRTVSASQLNDSFALRHVNNYYNRVLRPLRVMEATNSWVYDSTTYQQANNAAANQLDLVCGVAEEALDVQVFHFASHNASGGVSVSIGQDAITPVTGVIGMRTAIATTILPISAALRIIPAVGRHYYTWLESGGGATTTFYGDNNTPTLIQSGIHGTWRG